MTRDKLTAALDGAFEDHIKLLFKVLCLDSSADRRAHERFDEGLNIAVAAYNKAEGIIASKFQERAHE